MQRLKSARPTPALIVAMVALVAALSGAALAQSNKATVTSKDIKKGAVTKQKLANGAVTKKKLAKGAVGSQQIIGKSIKGNRIKDGGIKAKQIADATITGKKIADGAITGQQVADEGISSKNISDYAVISSAAGNFVKLTATDGATEAAARTAAPATELFKKGQITIDAKCFRDTTAGQTFAEIYVRTSANGAIFDGSDELSGGPAATDFLNTDTAEIDSRLDQTSVVGPDANLDEGEFTVVGADGTHLLGQTTIAAKDGNLAGGNGVYGDGNVCLFGGEISG